MKGKWVRTAAVIKNALLATLLLLNEYSTDNHTTSLTETPFDIESNANKGMHVILLDTECTVILNKLYQWKLTWEDMPKKGI